MSAPDGKITVRLTSVAYVADGIHSYELRESTGDRLPAFAAGAHVDLHLPNGITRPYSLINPATEQDRYVIAVKHERAGRGGSSYIHEALRVGTLIRIGPPRNNFPLHEAAPRSVLIAGGIGITPILAMAERLASLGRPWQLEYAVKERSQAAFMDRLGAHGDRVALHVDGEQGAVLDLAPIIAGAAPHAHLYCCGPEPMLQAFERATAAWPIEQVHLERFSGVEPLPADGGFTVELARSKRRITVPPGQSILDAIRAAGVAARASCEQGVCGSCETRVLSGVPDHRDMILSDAEKARGEFMMICCSGCLSGPLVLDL